MPVVVMAGVVVGLVVGVVVGRVVVPVPSSEVVVTSVVPVVVPTMVVPAMVMVAVMVVPAVVVPPVVVTGVGVVPRAPGCGSHDRDDQVLAHVDDLVRAEMVGREQLIGPGVEAYGECCGRVAGPDGVVQHPPPVVTTTVVATVVRPVMVVATMPVAVVMSTVPVVMAVVVPMMVPMMLVMVVAARGHEHQGCVGGGAHLLPGHARSHDQRRCRGDHSAKSSVPGALPFPGPARV